MVYAKIVNLQILQLLPGPVFDITLLAHQQATISKTCQIHRSIFLSEVCFIGC